MRINAEKGKFIVFEGLDGSGQTTQANLLTKWIMEKSRNTHTIRKNRQMGR